jgi:lysophospholipase L1-like esterase
LGALRIRDVITDPDAVRVLCFGDSNTYGCPGDDVDYVRLPADRRWTGVLQRLLGDGYDVIEEGLNGAPPMWTTRIAPAAMAGPTSSRVC